MSDIIIDLSRDSKFDELGLKRLKESYMMPGRNFSSRKDCLCM